MNNKTWFVTGAGRGLGFDLVNTAVAAGHRVVATARNLDNLKEALSKLPPDRLLCLELDVTNEAQAVEAMVAAVARFGGIDVLVNNAGYGQMGMFEDNTQADAEHQFSINFFGLLKVTRAVLPVMRRQRSGRIFNVSSYVGVQGFPAASLYCASKFAVEGFSESLAQEVAAFGIAMTLVEPGVFRTDFMDPASIRYGANGVADYAEATKTFRAYTDTMSGTQTGDPKKLAATIMDLSEAPKPPLHFAAGTDAVEVISGKLAAFRTDLEAWRKLSTSLAFSE